MADKPQVLRETDDEARRLARLLVRGARFMAFGVIDPETGFPSVSRALTATDFDGVPVILVSALSGHTKGLAADPRCSLLAGEPGKGDPLAHPRITLQCRADTVERDAEDHARIRHRFLGRHPKASLYVDFPDFRFFRLLPQTASLNGGFGRAYALSGSDLLIEEPGNGREWLELQDHLKEMAEAAALCAEQWGAEKGRPWRFAGVDRSGVDLVGGDLHFRHEFATPAASPGIVFDCISNVAKVIPLPEN